MSFDRQTTLRAAVTLTGIGVHSGAPASICLQAVQRQFRRGLPAHRHRWHAAPDHSRQAHQGQRHRALHGHRRPAAQASGLDTIEHLMSACSGLGLDNVLVEIDGPEDADHGRQRHEPSSPRSRRPASSRLVRPPLPQGSPAGPHRAGPRLGRAGAGGEGFRLDVEIDFDTAADRPPAQGLRSRSPRPYASEIIEGPHLRLRHAMSSSSGRRVSRSAPRSRTRLAIGEDKVINPEGLRYGDEFVRHKVLDAIGATCHSPATRSSASSARLRRVTT